MFSLVLLLSPWASMPAQEPENLPARIALLEQRIEEARVKGNIPSLGFALVNRDGVLWAGGFGQADFSSNRAANENTLYAIGSTTKAFTSTVIADLVDEGLLSWDVPAQEVLPIWTLQGKDGETITLRDLLSHRTGYPRMGLLFASGKVDSTKILATAAKAKPFRGYHEEFLYNNIQYLAAGTAAASVGGASWESLVESRLLDPLGMHSTTASFARAVGDSRRATGYRWDREKSEHVVMPPRNISNTGPAGSIYSNANDMSRWVQFQLNHGAWKGTQLVSPENMNETWVANIEIGPGVDYGMGWMLHDWQGQRWIEHGGNIDGYSAKVGMLPDSGYGFVMLCNLNGAPIQGEIDPLVWTTLLDPLPGSETEQASDAGPAAELDFKLYLGEYLAGFPPFSGQALEVIDEDGELAVVVPGQGTFAMHMPDENGMWVWKLTDTIKISFDGQAEGQAHTLILHQNGLALESLRKGYEPAAEVPLDELQPFLGVYRLEEADMDWTILIRNNRLAVDVPSEMVYDLRPANDEGWRLFRAKDDLMLRFRMADSGSIEGLEMRNGSNDLFLPWKSGSVDALPSLEEIYAIMKLDERQAALDAWNGSTFIIDLDVEQSGVTGVLTASSDGSGRMTAKIDFGEFGTGRTAIDSDSGWSVSDFEPFRELGNEKLLEAREEGGLTVAISDFRLLYDDIKVEKRGKFQGRDHWILNCKRGALSSRPATKIYVQCDTGEIHGVRTHIDLDGAGYMPIRTVLDDYREVQGVRVPHRIRVENQASGRATQTVREVRPGEGPSEADFIPPKQN
jgi:CubicO group peptidase (beta-lactamase class C family)